VRSCKRAANDPAWLGIDHLGGAHGHPLSS